MIAIVFIVNGAEVRVRVDRDKPLRDAIDQALEQTGNQSRPINDWELRDERGRLLDTARSSTEYGFSSSWIRLFLTFRLAAGG